MKPAPLWGAITDLICRSFSIGTHRCGAVHLCAPSERRSDLLKIIFIWRIKIGDENKLSQGEATGAQTSWPVETELPQGYRISNMHFRTMVATCGGRGQRMKLHSTNRDIAKAKVSEPILAWICPRTCRASKLEHRKCRAVAMVCCPVPHSTELIGVSRERRRPS